MTKRSHTKLSSEAEFDLLVAEEALILEAQMLIQGAMNDQGMSQKELAELLGVGASYVSQMLGLSPRNLTLRTVARVMHALGLKAQIRRQIEKAVTGAEAALAKRRFADTAEAVAIASKAAATLDSAVWGNVYELPPRAKTRRRGKVDARAFAEFDPQYLMAA